MVNCKFCDVDISTQKLIPPHLRWCKKYKIWKDENLTYDFIYDEYIVQGKSANQIALDLNFCTSAVINKRITALGIPKRGISASKRMPKCVERTKNTNIDRWGSAHNFNRDHPSRIEWEERLWRTEGIINVFQRESVKTKVNDWHREHGKAGTFGARISQIHHYVYNMLTDNGILCENEFPIKKDKRYTNFYDITILNSNELIEINGDLWHANPQLYKSSDVVYLPCSKTPKSPQIFWDRDENKRILASKHGYTVTTIWEYDIHHNPQKVKDIVNNILRRLGYEENKIKEDYKKFKR